MLTRHGSGLDGAFTLDVKSVLNENLGGILGGTQCQLGHSSMLSKWGRPH